MFGEFNRLFSILTPLYFPQFDILLQKFDLSFYRNIFAINKNGADIYAKIFIFIDLIII